MRSRLAVIISIAQSILFLGHWILYVTWTRFILGPGSTARGAWAWAFFALSLSFVCASVLAMRYANPAVGSFYALAAGWLGFLDCLVLGSAACWLIWVTVRLTGRSLDPHWLGGICLGAAAALGIYGIANATATRVTRVSLKLPHLPEQWRGRIAAVASDLHLGNVRGSSFARRIAQRINSLKPHVVFIVGDVFDGAGVDPVKLAAPLRELRAPYGAYFVTGNHEEFGDPARFVGAIQDTGIRVLANEKIHADGLQIFGVSYRTSVYPPAYAAVLDQANIDRNVASIALVHAPNNLPAAEQAGISLQLSGHTHRGQMFPFTWFTKRVYKEFVYGLHWFREMLVLTSSGAGTWGPPMRIGTNPEIVLIQFE